MRLYFDNDSGELALIRALVSLGFDCLDSRAAGMARASDPEQLAFATTQGRTIIAANQGDFTRLHYEWVGTGHVHAGILVASKELDIGERLRALRNIEAALTQEAMVCRIEWLKYWLSPPEVSARI